MYFISQIQKQFFAQIFSYTDSIEGPTPAVNDAQKTDISTPWSSEKFGVNQEAFQKLTVKKQEQLKILFDKLSALEKDVVDNNLDKKFLTTGATILARIETDASYKPTAPEDTKAYNELVEKLKSYKERIGKIDTDNVQKREQISMLNLEISQILGEIPSQKSEGSIDQEMVAQEEKDDSKNEELILKIAKLETEVIGMGDITLENTQKILKTHGYKLVIQALGELREIPQTELSPEKRELVDAYQKILQLGDIRNIPEAESLQSINRDEFTNNYPLNSRLKYFTTEGIDAASLKKGLIITASFRYLGKENTELADTLSAGQMFPESVSRVELGGKIYERKGLEGEFYALKSEKLSSERLVIFDGDVFKIDTLRTPEEIQSEKESIDTRIIGLGDITAEAKKIAEVSLRQGMQPDSQLSQVISDVVSKSDLKNGARENAVSDAVQTLGNQNENNWDINSIDTNELAKNGIVGVMLAFIIKMFQNKSDGSISEEGQSYAAGIGISPEDVKKYGNTGSQLAQWVKGNGYPVYEGKPSYCGKNVGEALDHFGIKGLPQSGRNGADWANICRSRPNQFKQINCTPEEAPAGALISYERNTGGSKARQQSGHIEIALGQGKGYYFGKVSTRPGGSNTAPKAGDYTVWMPISKNS